MTPAGPARVTLVIATHDRHEYLLSAVDSAARQTYPAVDLVIADDGSTSPRLLEMLDALEKDGYRVLRGAHRGVSAAVNDAVAANPSVYFMRLDDDDVIDPPYIEEAVQIAERDPDVGVVYCRADLFGTEEGPWDLPPFEIGSLLIDNQIFSTSLFRRADWRTVGGYDESMREGREDHDFLLKVVGLGRTVHRLDGTYFHYRRHSGPSLNAITGSSPEKRARAYATMFRNNQALYAEHAEEFWLGFFQQLSMSKELRLRYRHLERLRRGHPRLTRLLRASRIIRSMIVGHDVGTGGAR